MPISQDEFFPGCPAATMLQPGGNIGLAMRWHAALAEMQAFFDVSVEKRAAIIESFGQTIRAAISERPRFALLPPPEPIRDVRQEAWERMVSVFPFAIVDPWTERNFLGFEKMQALYRWLNADLSGILPHERLASSRICHIGQPIALPNKNGAKPFGALRISAGARLVSGESSHAHLSNGERLERVLQDVRAVFEKIDVILRNWHVVEAANLETRYSMF